MSRNSGLTLPSQVRLEDISTPEIMAFVEYWQSLKGDAFAPSWKDFDLAALDPKSIPFVIVVDVLRNPLNFLIRFWGTAHAARKGEKKSGISVTDPPNYRDNTAHEEYRWVVNEKKLLAISDIVNLKDFRAIRPFEQKLVRLPLSDDGEHVDNVVSLAAWEKI